MVRKEHLVQPLFTKRSSARQRQGCGGGVEKEIIKQVLEITNGKKVEAAEILGITRNTLRTKMNYYDLE